MNKHPKCARCAVIPLVPTKLTYVSGEEIFLCVPCTESVLKAPNVERVSSNHIQQTPSFVEASA